MTTESMLTTVDNPYDPFTQFNEWYAYDTEKGYHTASFLSRIVVTADSLPESEIELDIERAIDEIVSENVLGIYKKVTREI